MFWFQSASAPLRSSLFEVIPNKITQLSFYSFSCGKKSGCRRKTKFSKSGYIGSVFMHDQSSRIRLANVS